MRKFLALVAFLFVPALSFCGQYVSLAVGPDYAYRTDDSEHGQKVGYKVGGSYGYLFGNSIRGELELCYRDSSKRTKYEYSEGGDDQKTHISSHSMSYLANVLYDVGELSTYGLVPYVGGGVGMCSNTYSLRTKKGDVTVNKDSGKDDRFAWQIIAGAKYPVAEKTEVAVEYKYFVGAYHAKNHSVSAALVRSF
jgi:opacity protein-like surface antigen